MNRNEEPRVLRLEAEANRLEARLASDEARVAQLEQRRRPPGSGGAVAVTPLSFVVNYIVELTGVAVGSWSGSTVEVRDAGSVLVGSGTTDDYGYCSFWFLLDPGEVGKVYSVTISHAGFTSNNYTVTIALPWTGMGTPGVMSLVVLS